MADTTIGTSVAIDTPDLEISEFAVLELLSLAASKAHGNHGLDAVDLANDVRAKLSPELFEIVAPICDAITMCAMANWRLANAPERESKHDAFVYFLRRSDGLIKIGFAKDDEARIRQLHPVAGSELELLAKVEGGQSKEASLHKKFAHLRHHREWFLPGDDLLEFISSVSV